MKTILACALCALAITGCGGGDDDQPETLRYFVDTAVAHIRSFCTDEVRSSGPADYERERDQAVEAVDTLIDADEAEGYAAEMDTAAELLDGCDSGLHEAVVEAGG